MSESMRQILHVYCILYYAVEGDQIKESTCGFQNCLKGVLAKNKRGYYRQISN